MAMILGGILVTNRANTRVIKVSFLRDSFLCSRVVAAAVVAAVEWLVDTLGVV